jgi:hypothetical protein
VSRDLIVVCVLLTAIQSGLTGDLEIRSQGHQEVHDRPGELLSTQRQAAFTAINQTFSLPNAGDYLLGALLEYSKTVEVNFLPRRCGGRKRIG